MSFDYFSQRRMQYILEKLKTIFDTKADSSDIPTVGNGTLTIKRNGTKVNDFTANSSSNVTADISVPTKVSDLTNDSGFVASSDLGTAAYKDVPTSGNASSSQVVMGNDTRLTDSRSASDVYSWAKAENKPTYTASEVGLGNVPNVSTNDQTPTFTEADTRANIASGEKLSVILGKIKKFFTDLKTVAFTGSYSDLTDQPTIPTVPDIVDNLTTDDATKTLSAKQGKILNDNVTDYEKRGYLGKNLLVGIENGTWSADQEKTSNTTRARCTTIMSVDESKSYTVSLTALSSKTIQVRMSYYSGLGAGKRISSPDWENVPFTFTPPSGCKYITCIFRTTADDNNPQNYISNPQIEEGSTASSYQPYIKSNYELENEKVDKVASEIKTNTSGQFDTVTGGIMQSFIVGFAPKQSGSGTPSTSNIRPITGHTQAEGVASGKNLIGKLEQGSYVTETGAKNDDSASIRVRSLRFKLASGTYCISGSTSKNKTLQVARSTWTNGDYSNNPRTSDSGWLAMNNSFTLNSDQWVTFVFHYSDNSNILVSDLTIQLEKGSQPTEYEPIQDITVQFGNTYYGGYVDLVSGVLTVKNVVYSNTWGNGTGATNLGSVTRKIFDFTNTGLSTNESTTSEMDCAEYLNSWSENSVHYAVNASSHKDLYLFLPNGTSSDFAFQFCYELATPIEIQLSPSQINSLVGQNNLSAPLDGQLFVSAQYREVLSWDDVNEIFEWREVYKGTITLSSSNSTLVRNLTIPSYILTNHEIKVLTTLPGVEIQFFYVGLNENMAYCNIMFSEAPTGLAPTISYKIMVRKISEIDNYYEAPFTLPERPES